MPLVKATFKSDLESALLSVLMGDKTPEEAAEALAIAITDKVDAYIKTATVTIVEGIPVATTGTAAAQTGATTGPGTGTLS